MKSVACLGTVVAFVFGFCCSFCESTESTLTQGPKDTSVLTGETVTLECFTTNKNYPPLWSYQKVGSGEKKHISSIYPQGDRISITLLNGYVERHRIVENRNTGEYSLQITDAKPEDAGSYTCQARGGLMGAEIRSAELSVFEPFPACASNITDAVGENDCRKEPDVIELSCKFRIHGNYLPKIGWIDAKYPEEVIKNDTTTADATGMASSKLVIKGNYVGLDETSFKCIVASKGNADDKQFTCGTPKINVRKLSYLTESISLDAPEEVECTGWSNLNASGCEWFKRGDHDEDVFVTSKPLLNLHRSDMTAGTYSCFAKCNIRGETCPIKLLEVSYQPSPAVPPKSEIAYVAFVLPALIGAALIILFVIWKRHTDTKRHKKKDETAEMQAEVVANSHLGLQDPLLSPESLKESDSGHSDQQDTKISPGSSTESDSGLGSQQSSQPVSLEESDNSRSSQEGIPPSSAPPKDISIDITDAKLGGLTKSDRIRLIEERAEARMRANAAARQKSETNQAFSPDTDVAEGVAADKTKHE